MKKGLTIVSVLMLIFGIFTLVTGLLDVIGGLLGLKAAKHPAQATGAVIFGLLALIAGIASVVMQFSVQNLCACVLPLIYFVCAIAVKSSR